MLQRTCMATSLAGNAVDLLTITAGAGTGIKPLEQRQGVVLSGWFGSWGNGLDLPKANRMLMFHMQSSCWLVPPVHAGPACMVCVMVLVWVQP